MAKTITKLEAAGLTLSESLELLDEAHEKISKIPGKIGKVVQNKLNSVLGNNPGAKVLREISKIINGDQGELPEFWSASDAASLKYCPVQSADVERSFSVYKTVLTDQRHNLTEANLQKMMICNCYYNRD